MSDVKHCNLLILGSGVYYFWMVCKQGSVTKAAEALFLTPQTVTGQIKALEERMDAESDLQFAEPDFKGMSKIGYDAMALGNHEFDKHRIRRVSVRR